MMRWLKLLVVVLVASFAYPAFTVAESSLVKDILPGIQSSYPTDLMAFNGAVYFSVHFTVPSSEGENELWKSDGTPGGTVPVRDLFPGGDGSASQLTVSGGKLFFRGYDGSEVELWVSDGTTAGTVKLDINGAPGSGPDGLVDMNGILYFSAADPTYGRELWRSDGTPGGTYLVRDLKPGDSLPTQLTPNGNRLYFAADGLITSAPDLWVSDGTSAGTTLLQIDTSPNYLAAVGPRVFFQAGTGSDRELYAATPAGAVLVKNINPSGVSECTDIGAFGNIALFSANDGINGYELWRSDGTAAGTYMVKDIDPRPFSYPGAGYSFPRGFKTLGSISIFTAIPNGAGRELWRTDGTEAGTYRVKDINPDGGDSVEPRFSELDGYFYFDTDDGTHGGELWRTDGTDAGTVLASDIRPGSPPSYPWQRAVLGTALYFNAYGVDTYGDYVGAELFRYDPTATPVSASRPEQLTFEQNYPNPFNPTTTIDFVTAARQHVTLSVYDVRGQLVRGLVDRSMPAGSHRQEWDGRDDDGQVVASGVYFLQLRTPDRMLVRKAVMLK